VPDFFLQANLKGCSFGWFQLRFQQCHVVFSPCLFEMQCEVHYKLFVPRPAMIYLLLTYSVFGSEFMSLKVKNIFNFS
jgi:hypothetical protein